MDSNMKDFWVFGIFFFLIGGFIGFLWGFSPNAAVTGYAVKEELPACFDSDGGRAILTYGYSTTSKERYFDNCDDSLTLNEAHCTADSQIAISKITCNYGCRDGVCLTE